MHGTWSKKSEQPLLNMMRLAFQQQKLKQFQLLFPVTKATIRSIHFVCDGLHVHFASELANTFKSLHMVTFTFPTKTQNYSPVFCLGKWQKRHSIKLCLDWPHKQQNLWTMHSVQKQNKTKCLMICLRNAANCVQSSLHMVNNPVGDSILIKTRFWSASLAKCTVLHQMNRQVNETLENDLILSVICISHVPCHFTKTTNVQVLQGWELAKIKICQIKMRKEWQIVT